MYQTEKPKPIVIKREWDEIDEKAFREARALDKIEEYSRKWRWWDLS